MTTTLHAHVESSSADCDGTYSRDWTVFFNEDEKKESADADGVNDFSDIHFMERVMMSVASPYAARQMTVKVDDDGIEVSEATEEGYRNAEVRWCHEDCEDSHSFRDHRAESMGY